MAVKIIEKLISFNSLAPLPQDKMAAVLQMIFLDALLCMKSFVL